MFKPTQQYYFLDQVSFCNGQHTPLYHNTTVMGQYLNLSVPIPTQVQIPILMPPNSMDNRMFTAAITLNF